MFVSINGELESELDGGADVNWISLDQPISWSLGLEFCKLRTNPKITTCQEQKKLQEKVEFTSLQVACIMKCILITKLKLSKQA